MGAHARTRLDALRRRRRTIASVSGIGLLLAVTLEGDARLGSQIRDWCWRHGMILRNNGNILVLAPPLIITRAETDAMIDLIDRALAAAESRSR